MLVVAYWFVFVGSVVLWFGFRVTSVLNLFVVRLCLPGCVDYFVVTWGFVVLCVSFGFVLLIIGSWLRGGLPFWTCFGLYD